MNNESIDIYPRLCAASRSSRLAVLCVSAMLCLYASAAFAERGDRETERLVDAIYDIRADNGLIAIPFSRTLQRVAQLHVADLENHSRSARCNLHSWSSDGAWSPCCYTADHAQARCMWNKPREISRGRYAGDGFEIVCWHSERMMADIAMRCWRNSRLHENVILSRRQWRDLEWRALGVAMSAHYAVLWVGPMAEP